MSSNYYKSYVLDGEPFMNLQRLKARMRELGKATAEISVLYHKRSSGTVEIVKHQTIKVRIPPTDGPNPHH